MPHEEYRNSLPYQTINTPEHLREYDRLEAAHATVDPSDRTFPGVDDSLFPQLSETYSFETEAPQGVPDRTLTPQEQRDAVLARLGRGDITGAQATAEILAITGLDLGATPADRQAGADAEVANYLQSQAGAEEVGAEEVVEAPAPSAIEAQDALELTSRERDLELSRMPSGREKLFERFLASRPGFSRLSAPAQSFAVRQRDPLSAAYALQAAQPRNLLEGFDETGLGTGEAEPTFSFADFLSGQGQGGGAGMPLTLSTARRGLRGLVPTFQGLAGDDEAKNRRALTLDFLPEDVQRNILTQTAGTMVNPLFRPFLGRALNRRFAQFQAENPQTQLLEAALRPGGAFGFDFLGPGVVNPMGGGH